MVKTTHNSLSRQDKFKPKIFKDRLSAEYFANVIYEECSILHTTVMTGNNVYTINYEHVLYGDGILSVKEFEFYRDMEYE